MFIIIIRNKCDKMLIVTTLLFYLYFKFTLDGIKRFLNEIHSLFC